MAFSRMTVSVNDAHTVLGMNVDPGREVWEYEDGKKTNRQRRDAQGRPLFRFDALMIGLSESGMVEVSLLLTSPEPLGVNTQVFLEHGASGVVRPKDAFELTGTFTGVRVFEKPGK